MAFEISIIREFAAAHQLRLYDGSLEALHGHNWRVRVTVGADGLDSIGVVMDFHVLARRVEEVISPWRNGNLNDVAALAEANPSAENVALAIARGLRLPERVGLRSVEVWETSTDCAVYRP